MTGFVGGLAEGLQGLPQEVEALLGISRQRKSDAALAAWAAAQGQQQPPQAGPAPQPQPQPQGNPMAALAAIGGRGGPPAPAPAPAMAPPKPGPAGLPGGGGAPPQAGPPQPMGPPPPNPNLSATAQPDQKFNDPIQEAQQTLGAMIRSVKAANPKIDPLTLMNAVHTQLDDMKGILPVTKAVMQSQVGMLKDQARYQYLGQKLSDENDYHAQQMGILSKKAATAAEYQKEKARHDGVMENLYSENISSRETIADENNSTRRSIAGDNNQTRREIAGENNQTREEISGDRSDDSTYRSDQGVRGAQIRSGQTPDAPPQRRAGASRSGPKTVNGPDEIRKLPSGTKWVSADGKRHGVAP